MKETIKRPVKHGVPEAREGGSLRNASPILWERKKGELRICDDFKVCINGRTLHEERFYSILRQYFTDFSDEVYAECPLLQCPMNLLAVLKKGQGKLLRGLKGIIGFQDDLLVSGTKLEHCGTKCLQLNLISKRNESE